MFPKCGRLEPVAHVGGGLVGKAAEDEQQQLVVVSLVGQVPEMQIIEGKAKNFFNMEGMET